MDQYILDNLSKKLKIAPLNIVRENFEMGILNVLSQSEISGKMIFYGGTALRLAYGSPRFSEDLDFLMIQKIRTEELNESLTHFIKEYSEASIKDLRDKRNTLFALINIKSHLLKQPLNIKIEIAKRKDGIKYEFIPLASSCSHLQPIVPTIKIESLEKLKQKAIEGREEPRDWFDLWYIRKYLKKPFVVSSQFPFAKKEFKEELKRFLPQDKWVLIDQMMQ
ncbi:MAG: nucleotidyl transferase AbiEii/AbiGii toxin family protein [Candidatus Kuenenbacteria bacterium]